MDDLIFSQPDSAEQAWDIMASLIKSKDIGLVVLDSMSVMPTKRELEGEATDEHVAELARLNSKELRKITASIKAANVAVIFISQLREKIGFNPTGQEQTTTAGGRSVKFYASLRLEVKKKGQIQITQGSDKITTGQKTSIKTAKNKVGPALRTINVILNYPTDVGGGVIQSPGFDGIAALITRAIEMGIISGGGAKSYTFPDGESIRGAQNARSYLADQPELMKQLLTQVTSG
jgi:recombination protein RecA